MKKGRELSEERKINTTLRMYNTYSGASIGN